VANAEGVDRTRKTDKGLPHYCDGEGSEVFILSGADKAMTSKAAQAGPHSQSAHRTDAGVCTMRSGRDLEPHSRDQRRNLHPLARRKGKRPAWTAALPGLTPPLEQWIYGSSPA
jgi:hypothetical protein